MAKHRLEKSLPCYAESHSTQFIAAYGIDRALIVAKLTTQKIIASKKSLERKYGAGSVMKCTQHPKYQAIRKPRVACGICWDIFESKHKNDKKGVT